MKGETQKHKRAICGSCGYPETTCLCRWVEPIQSPINIVILQHPKEAKHAKNTVRLLSLSLSNIKIFQGENQQDFGEIFTDCQKHPERYSLCYPNEKSVPIESVTKDSHSTLCLTHKTTIIFLDASWRKALKMWHLNPWLHSINSWHFSAPPNNQYQIRHTTQKNSLSTLESVAYVLQLTQNVDCSSLYTLFQKMQVRCFGNTKFQTTN